MIPLDGLSAAVGESAAIGSGPCDGRTAPRCKTLSGSQPARTITYAKPAIGALRGGRVREVVMRCLVDCDSVTGIPREGYRVMPS